MAAPEYGRAVWTAALCLRPFPGEFPKTEEVKTNETGNVFFFYLTCELLL